MLLIIIILSIFIALEIYFNKIILKKVPSKRKQKIFELLKNKFDGLKENDLGFFECNIDKKSFLFEYKTSRYKYRLTNHLTIYFDITNTEEDIKKLCKIHFDCSTIDNRDWVKEPVDLLFCNSLDSLANYSEKTIQRVISETEFYISQKRAERDKKISTY